MKNKLHAAGIIIMFVIFCSESNAQNANTNLSNLISPVSVNLNFTPDKDNKRNIGSAAKSWKDIYLDGSLYLGGAKFLAYQTGTGTGNTAVGSAVLNANTFGEANTGTGFNALFFNTVGGYNTANGYLSLYNNNTGNFNTASGTQSLTTNTDGSYNTAFGNVALYFNLTGNDNTAIGAAALKANQTGNKNTSIGRAALYNNTSGNDNIAAGINALYNNQTGYSNVAIGTNALYANVSGHNLVAVGDSALFNQTVNSDGLYYNTAIGSKALFSNIDGHVNTANGVWALYSNTSGENNTGNGALTLYLNTIGSFNVADGSGALYSNTSGSGNAALGQTAGYTVTTGSNNTFLGFNADCAGAGALTNSTAIGYNASVLGNNKVIIGNSSVTSIGGYANWSNFSDGRYKQNIKQNVPGLAFINKLTPITYTLNVNAIESKLHEGQKKLKTPGGKSLPNPNDNPIMKQAMSEKSKIVYTGFVAQDVEKAARDLNYDFSGVDKPQDANQSFYGLRYSDFVVPLVKAVQELSSENSELKSENDKQQNQIENLQNQINELKRMMNVQQSLSPNNKLQTANISSASLEQNIPNPFNQTTTINYSLPKQFSSAKIIVTDNAGKTLKEINVSGTGKKSVQINASMLLSGAYQYSLYVDGKLIDTKQMMLMK